ncbi:hypothetical protein PR048_016120 [Dryococelus australis]|uniref:Uncharacterized protein n=1 Tax=Dryococelus australis TaxID=614101 RepID=A0ABQ9HIV4_9NEOP|nr:hypothetical protein PR048_016120 [Dryococelus australis]
MDWFMAIGGEQSAVWIMSSLLPRDCKETELGHAVPGGGLLGATWHPRVFVCGNQAGRCHWLAGYLGILLFAAPFHSGAAPYVPQSPSSALKISLLHGATHSSLIWRGLPTEFLQVREKNKRWAEQGAALVCLWALGVVSLDTLVKDGPSTGWRQRFNSHPRLPTLNVVQQSLAAIRGCLPWTLLNSILQPPAATSIDVNRLEQLPAAATIAVTVRALQYPQPDVPVTPIELPSYQKLLQYWRNKLEEPQSLETRGASEASGSCYQPLMRNTVLGSFVSMVLDPQFSAAKPALCHLSARREEQRVACLAAKQPGGLASPTAGRQSLPGVEIVNHLEESSPAPVQLTKTEIATSWARVTLHITGYIQNCIGSQTCRPQIGNRLVMSQRQAMHSHPHALRLPLMAKTDQQRPESSIKVETVRISSSSLHSQRPPLGK